MPTDDWTTGEIVRSLKRIEESQGELKLKVDGLAVGFLPRSEWALWAESRDREIRDLKAARAPWWTWATVIIAVLSLLLALLPRLA